jgi:YfiH family protein
VRVADCVPVLLADASAGVLGCAHAGRSGLAGGVVPNTLEAMRALGARRVRAWVGPCVCGGCYEVPEQMREEVAAVVPQARSTTRWGTPALDIGTGVEAQLRAEGCDVVATARRCTREDPDLYSHRRDGARAGRFAGLVWRRP